MEDLESKLARLPLRRPSPGLDDRVRSAKPEPTETKQLDRQLLGQSPPADGKELKMRKSMFGRIPRMLRLAASLMAAVVLVGSGWAAEKIYKKMTQLVVEREDPKRTRSEYALTLPDGSTRPMTYSEPDRETVSVSGDPAERQAAIDAVKQKRAEVKRLVAEKKYEFVKEFKESNGEKRYTYKFKLANDEEIEEDLDARLENVASWDEYIEKASEEFAKHNIEINKAIKAGRFRLIDAFTYHTQLCRDVNSGRKLRVQQVDRKNGSTIARITPDNAPEEEESWKDHLQAIREGRRELVGLDDYGIDFSYELVLDDGSKVIFGYGGHKPLAPLVDPEEWSYKALGHE
jgi:hypothetical protein